MGDQYAYRLSTTLKGHSMDVRAVGVTHHQCILSASRDATAKLWHPEGFDIHDNRVKDFAEVTAFRGHAGFVSSVCFLNPCRLFPDGLVLTGGNDAKICGYTLQDSSPRVVLEGHEGPVCCLFSSESAPGTFYSASWDSTGRVWSIEEPKSPLRILKGHSAAVWGIAELGNGTVATCSADKTIALWDRSGEKLKTLAGHGDCVRGLAVADARSFLSCGNDATVRLWSNDGNCIDTFYGHSNYIYSICVNPAVKGLGFVTCGEDSTMRVWSGGDNVCTVLIPAQSVWSVVCLNNGDIVAGSSDGIVRVFTTDKNRRASDEAMKAFEDDAKNFHHASSREIGGIKVTDLPGPEVLYEPGKSDGQTKLIRTGATVKCFSWDAGARKWNEIGDVMGSAAPSEGKTMYEGKEYDFVFSVDIEDGKPPLKLPYNRGEDCWISAQNFIHKNNLPQVYLEQVANFIVKNSGQSDNVQSNDGFMDPFTGESRYVPTGGDKNNGSGENLAGRKVSSKYFPQISYLKFEQGNIPLILEKMKEFNGKGLSSVSFTDMELEKIANLGKAESTCSAETVNQLKQLLSWPKDILFPVLDIARLAVRNSRVNEQIFDENSFGPAIMEILLDNLLPGNSNANQLLSLRLLANAFAHPAGRTTVTRESENILNSLLCFTDVNKNVQIVASTLLLNFTIASAGKNETGPLIDCVLHAIANFSDEEAYFRSLVALGTLLSRPATLIEASSKLVLHDDCTRKLKTPDASHSEKTLECSMDILRLL